MAGGSDADEGRRQLEPSLSVVRTPAAGRGATGGLLNLFNPTPAGDTDGPPSCVSSSKSALPDEITVYWPPAACWDADWRRGLR